MREVTREITNAIVHCSASDKKSQDSVEAITELHTSPPIRKFTWGEYLTSGKGFSANGYHYIITQDGKTHIGRSLERPGAHCYGFNQLSVGICLTGNLHFTKAQFDSLRILCMDLCQEFDFSLDNINPHSRFNSKKTCPNCDLKAQKALWIE